MATAYASLVSLIHVLNRIQHPSCPAFFDDKQLLESLFDKTTWLINFLEDYSHTSTDGMKHLEILMANSARQAEDLLEMYVVGQILYNNVNPPWGDDNKTFYFHSVIETVMQGMDAIKELMPTEEVVNLAKSHIPVRSLVPETGDSIVIGQEEVLLSLMEKIVSHQPIRQIISVVGMGGIGKTTLCRNVFLNPLICQRFDIKAWVTISQDYSVKNVLKCLLRDIGEKVRDEFSCEQFGEQLRKELYSRKYLIVLDDIWESVAWDKIWRYFPENNNGSRILISTRLKSVALRIGSARSTYEMKLLDEDESWELLSKIVFGQGICPHELRNLGKKIAVQCEGLPLAIVVMGGLLRVSAKTREYWEDVESNLNSEFINAQNDEYCSKILSLSYNHLPIHLKPCFLYMSGFLGGISVSKLMKLWVSDGFLKPQENKTMEVVALECFNDLCDRNLVSVIERCFSGKAKMCKLHDLIKDLCLREVQKERFLFVIENNTQRELELDPILCVEVRRIVDHRIGSDEARLLMAPKSFVRSLTLPEYSLSSQDPVGAQIDCVRNNLQTVRCIESFKCTSKMVNKIPNVRKLGLEYQRWDKVSEDVKSSYCLDNLVHLQKLEKLHCFFNYIPSGKCVFNESFTLPQNLRKLSLGYSNIPWDNMKIVGSLSNLEVLHLHPYAFYGQEWNTTEGEFQRLRYLDMYAFDLVTWTTESSHFPCLERLFLDTPVLKEIPWGVGEVATLESMELSFCRLPVIKSAKDILEERQSSGNDDLLVKVTLSGHDSEDEEVKSWANEKFHVRDAGSNMLAKTQCVIT